MLTLPGYKIEKKIGQGGMATIYLAIHEGLHRKVAIKLMAEDLAKEHDFSARFMREARIVANLTHQHIVTVYDVNVHNSYHYIAMEYLPGGITLDHKIKAGLTHRQGIEIIRQIAAALGFAHSKDIIHRDVKPENIMFREDGNAVLTDFGIARSTLPANNMTASGMVIGTPHYMSPEQALGKPLGPYADIYSLGVVLFETLTGKVPYEADSTIAAALKHITEPVPTLEGELAIYQPLLNLMLAKKEQDRYQNCADIITDITSLLASGVVSHTTLRNNATRIQQVSQNKRAPHPTAFAGKHTPSRDNRNKNLRMTGIAVSALVLSTLVGYMYYSQQDTSAKPDQAEPTQLQQAISHPPQTDALAQQQAAQSATQQTAEEQAATRQQQDESESARLAQQRAAADEAHLQAEMALQKRQQAKLEAETKMTAHTANTAQAAKAAQAVKEKQQRETTQKINQLLASAENNLLNSQLKTAYENFKAVLQIQPDNRLAKEGINRVATEYLSLASHAASNHDFDIANQYINSVITIAPTHHKLAATQAQVNALKQAQTTPPPAQQIDAAPAATEPPKKRQAYGGF